MSSTNTTQRDRLTLADRFRIGSNVFVPASLLNLFFIMLRGAFHSAEWQFITLYTLNFAIAVFAVMPWAVRRATRIDFPRFHLVVLRSRKDRESRTLTYGESLKLSILVAIGTLGAAVLPFQWALLPFYDMQWPYAKPAVGIMWLGICTLTGSLLLWNGYDAFSLNVRRLDVGPVSRNPAR